MAISNLRNSLFDQYTVGQSVSPLDPFLMDKKKKKSPFISPVEVSIDSAPEEPKSEDLGISEIKKQPKSDWYSRYEPETRDTDRFRSLLDQFPQREEPSTLRKLVAGGMGMDARQRVGTPGQEFTARGNPLPTMEAVLQQPYLQKLDDWKEKAQPYYNAANLERQENVNTRNWLHNVSQSEYQNERNRINEERYVRDAEIREIRAHAYDWAQRHPGWTWDKTGPTYKIINPETKEVQDTGIPTGRLDRMTEINLQNQGRIESARQLGQNRLNAIGMQGWDIMQDSQGGQYWVNEPGMNIVPMYPGQGQPVGGLTKVPQPKAVTPNEQPDEREVARGRMNRLAEAYKFEKFRKHIDKQGNDYTLKNAPSSMFGSPNPDDVKSFNDLQNFILTGKLPPETSVTPKDVPPPATGPAIPPVQGMRPDAPLQGGWNPGNYKLPPNAPPPPQDVLEAAKKGAKTGYNSGTKKWEYSLDGGKTWIPSGSPAVPQSRKMHDEFGKYIG